MSDIESFLSEEISILKTTNEYIKNQNVEIKFIFAIDEVGRGCLAGDVVVGITSFIQMPCDDDVKAMVLIQNKIMAKAKDSKKMTEKRRKEVFNSLMELFSPSTLRPMDIVDTLASEKVESKVKFLPMDEALLAFRPEDSFSMLPTNSFDVKGFGLRNKGPTFKNIEDKNDFNLILSAVHVCSASAEEIGELGIFNATNLAMARALTAAMLTAASINASSTDEVKTASLVIIDGDKAMSFPRDILPRVQATVIKGDDRLKSLSLASVLAKVARDDQMLDYSKRFPDYGFENHKGYGTKEHYEAIKTLGALSVHRKGFRLF